MPRNVELGRAVSIVFVVFFGKRTELENQHVLFVSKSDQGNQTLRVLG